MGQFQKALDLQSGLVPSRVYLALLLLRKGRADDAIREAKAALSQDPENASAHNVLGSAYLSKGNHAEGLAELNKALALDPSLADVDLKKALVALKGGKGLEAESELSTALRIKPEAQEARLTLALYYINTNELAKARSMPSKTTSQPMLSLQPVKPADWPEIETLFGPNGAAGGCWCQWWRVEKGGKSWDACKGAPNRLALKAQIEAGAVHAVLARRGRQAVGWCCIGPREDFPRAQFRGGNRADT